MVVNNISSDSGVRIQEGYWSRNQGAPQAPQSFKQKKKIKIFFTWEYSKEWYSSGYFPCFLMSTMITNHVTAFLQNRDIPSGCGEALNDIRLSTLNSFVRHNRCMKNQTTAPSNTDRQLFHGIFFFLVIFLVYLWIFHLSEKKESSTEQLFLIISAMVKAIPPRRCSKQPQKYVAGKIGGGWGI